MDSQAEHVLQIALALPENDRAEIAGLLIQSRDEKADPDVEAAWAAEIKRRIDEIDSGKVKLIPSEQVMREMRAILDSKSPDCLS